jgi:hypothetical protein
MTREEVQSEIGRLRDRLISAYNVDLTREGAGIIADCCNAILEDPHPSWPHFILNDRDRLAAFQTDAINALPLQILFVAEQAGTQRVTTFDLLHAMSRILDRICPFEKPQPPARQPR